MKPSRRDIREMAENLGRMSDFPRWKVRLLISSIIDSLNRGSLSWDDEQAWSDLEMGYNEIKGE